MRGVGVMVVAAGVEHALPMQIALLLGDGGPTGGGAGGTTSSPSRVCHLAMRSLWIQRTLPRALRKAVLRGRLSRGCDRTASTRMSWMKPSARPMCTYSMCSGCARPRRHVVLQQFVVHDVDHGRHQLLEVLGAGLQRRDVLCARASVEGKGEGEGRASYGCQSPESCAGTGCAPRGRCTAPPGQCVHPRRKALVRVGELATALAPRGE